ncbi:MAG: efflux RND transporter periplasmic adaptor subunit [Desulfovibrio sp.]|jgi:multidrug efflux system membrane fusion protein|nr:efflux RND transporter periplasmic adaptor subunit [Desulfovibrio sp.]
MKFKRIFQLPALACLFFLAACGNQESGQNKTRAAPVHVAAVEQASVPRIVHAVGNVSPSAQVAVVPRVAGEIVEVNFREGSDVAAGDQLIRIDPRPYEAALKEKKGLLAKSQAQLAKAIDDRARYGKLVGQGFVSKEAYQQTATDAAALGATVQSDRAGVESAALDLSYCTVRAPISGRAGVLRIDKGNMIKANDANPIVEIETISPCYVFFSVPEAHLPIILDLASKGRLPLVATPPQGSPEDGFLTLVDNNVDTKTGTIRLRGSFENTGRRLWPGQFVQIELPLGMAENALVVPSRAVLSGRDGSYVYLVGEEGRAATRNVRVLFENGGKSVLDGKLAAGDKVVVDGQVRLADGVPVKILD